MSSKTSPKEINLKSKLYNNLQNKIDIIRADQNLIKEKVQNKIKKKVLIQLNKKQEKIEMLEIKMKFRIKLLKIIYLKILMNIGI